MLHSCIPQGRDHKHYNVNPLAILKPYKSSYCSIYSACLTMGKVYSGAFECVQPRYYKILSGICPGTFFSYFRLKLMNNVCTWRTALITVCSDNLFLSLSSISCSSSYFFEISSLIIFTNSLGTQILSISSWSWSPQLQYGLANMMIWVTMAAKTNTSNHKPTCRGRSSHIRSGSLTPNMRLKFSYNARIWQSIDTLLC